MHCKVITLVIFLLLLGCQPKKNVPTVIDLHQNWQFMAQQDSVWRNATVPGDIHSDLLTHNLIPDPFIGNNEDKVQWVSEKIWEYQSNFSVPDELLEKQHLQLEFNGLDTYAKVYVNDSLLLTANNAFRQWELDVKGILKRENYFRIVFEPTSIHENKAKEELVYQLPEGPRIFTRKAQFQYGWDWGPKLNTAGIWKHIQLVAYDDFKIKDIYIHQEELSETYADLSAEIIADSDIQEVLNYEIYVNNELKQSFQTKTSSATPTRIPFQIKNPKRWWPHNLGAPYLYDIKVLVKHKNLLLDSISIKKGLRTIELVTEKDSIGESFYFKVNNKPVYMKGANYIPQHSLQSQVKPTDYKNLLTEVVEANMNMLRVWGGGIYEDDLFYELCDEKGILVWQDFMFACAMYPGDDTFLNNVKIEAEQQVKRLRNYASLALWCGNNENSEGWHRWGWQDGRSEAEKQEIWGNYLKLFDSILPQSVERFSDTDYWESSPKYGRGNPKYEFEGDAHDWWIWHDAYPFEHLNAHVPRFMNEFGFQSFPSLEAIRYINQQDDIAIDSEEFKNHQKHHRGFQLIAEYMTRDFPVPQNPEDYIYMSQVLQAYGIGLGIKAHRRHKPRNMGTLYWQLNDCWPAVSWSSIDYFGNKKALQYQLKALYDNLLLSSIVENDTLNIYVVNDNFSAQSGELEIHISDFYGKQKAKFSQAITVENNTSALVFSLSLEDVSIPSEEALIRVKFKDKDEVVHLAKPKDLKLPNTDISIEKEITAEGIYLTLQSKSYQKTVFLHASNQGEFSDNFFDLFPNEPKRIFFKTDDKSSNDFNVKCLNGLWWDINKL